MKIVFVCDTLGSGGAERVISALSNEFVKSRHSVSIIMLYEASSEPFYKLHDDVSVIKLFNKKFSFIKKIKLLKHRLEDINADIVISFLSYVCIYTWLALRKTKIPYIVSERNDPNHRKHYIQFLLNRSFKRSSGCVFQTNDALEWYKNKKIKNSIVIHNPVNLDFKLNMAKDIKQQILYVGRFTEQKNCLMLLDAFNLFHKSHPNFILKMYGSGSMKSQIISKINTLKLNTNVLLLENSKTWQMDEAGTRMFVLPSKYEGMPNVLAEALCLGIPSVSTNCTIGGPKELKIIFKKRLILSKSLNYIDFANAMEESLNTEIDYPSVPQELNIEFIAQQWMLFINKVIGS